ncbi:MAG: ABC transporter substrate-binding protein [Methylococcales bacterium]|nr:ABC transporter substrate-binding protein [Methylococcales bacterium]
MRCKFDVQQFTRVLGLLAVMPVCGYTETIDLQLRWHHQFQFAGYYAAVQQGYYQKAGLDVVIHEGTPDKIAINEVLQGHAQYGVANSELLLARLKGDPLVLLAAIYQHSPSVLLARKDSGIFSPSDLVGKKVMMLGKTIDADFAAMFPNERTDITKINIIPSSSDIQDLITGKADAFNSYISNEPYFLKQQGIEFTVISPRNYGVDFYSDMLFTSENELKKRPERVKAFLDASLQGWHYAMAHPQEIIALLQNQYHVPKSKAHLEFEADTIRSLILPNLVEIGHTNPWRLQHMADTFVQAGMVENTDFLEDFLYAHDEIGERKQLIRYLKIMVVIALIISVIVAAIYAAYQSIRRENKQRIRMEEQLRQQTDELALHNIILQKIGQGIALPELLDELARQVEMLHPRMLCSILLLNNNQLLCGAAPSLPAFYSQALDGIVIGEGVGSCGTAVHRSERYVAEDLQKDPFWTPFRELTKQAGLQSCWSQPIKDNQGKVLGIFAIYHAQPTIPLSSEIELIESYANLAQLGIERTRANVALQESEQRLRFVLKGSGLGFWDWSIDSNTVQITNSNTDVLRHDATDIQSDTPLWLDFVYRDDREKVWYSIQQVLNGKQTTHEIEYRVFDKHGDVRWTLDHASIVQYNEAGKPVRMSGTHTDITERKLAEQQLRDSEQRLTLCQLYGGIGTWEDDLINNRQFWSSTTYKLLGIPEMENPTFEDFLAVIVPEDRQFVIDATEAHLTQRTKYDVEYRIIDVDNQLRWMRSLGQVDEILSNGKQTFFRGIVQDITERKAAEEQIKQLAFYDPLTQLPNRRLLYDRLQYGIELGKREGKKLAVLLLDLDHFKAVNDNLGHKAGDELLQKVAERIAGQLRKIDTAARLGGDEFVVVLAELAHFEDVERVALAIINELSTPFILRENDEVNIGTSIGISFYPPHGDSSEILLDCADTALYRAKDQGRSCFCVFQADNAKQYIDSVSAYSSV